MEPLDKVLQIAQLKKEQIDDIVMVGGSTRIPYVRQKVSEYFDYKKLNYQAHPDECVAMGAAYIGLMQSDTSGLLPELNFENETAGLYDSCYRRQSTINTRDDNSSEDDAADIADHIIAQDARISNEFEESVRQFKDICKKFESGSEFSS